MAALLAFSAVGRSEAPSMWGARAARADGLTTLFVTFVPSLMVVGATHALARALRLMRGMNMPWPAPSWARRLAVLARAQRRVFISCWARRRRHHGRDLSPLRRHRAARAAEDVLAEDSRRSFPRTTFAQVPRRHLQRLTAWRAMTLVIFASQCTLHCKVSTGTAMQRSRAGFGRHHGDPQPDGARHAISRLRAGHGRGDRRARARSPPALQVL